MDITGSLDPYVEVKVGNYKGVTKHLEKNQNPSEKSRPSVSSMKIQVGHQGRSTRPASARTYSPVWNEELMFVVAEPFDEYIIVNVDDKVGPGKYEIIGRLLILVREVPQRGDHPKLPDPRWFNLLKPSLAEEKSEKKKEVKFSSKIHLRLCIDAGYHILDESTPFSSDLQLSFASFAT